MKPNFSIENFEESKFNFNHSPYRQDIFQQEPTFLFGEYKKSINDSYQRSKAKFTFESGFDDAVGPLQDSFIPQESESDSEENKSDSFTDKILSSDKNPPNESSFASYSAFISLFTESKERDNILEESNRSLLEEKDRLYDGRMTSFEETINSFIYEDNNSQGNESIKKGPKKNRRGSSTNSFSSFLRRKFDDNDDSIYRQLDISQSKKKRKILTSEPFEEIISPDSGKFEENHGLYSFAGKPSTTPPRKPPDQPEIDCNRESFLGSYDQNNFQKSSMQIFPDFISPHQKQFDKEPPEPFKQQQACYQEKENGVPSNNKNVGNCSRGDIPESYGQNNFQKLPQITPISLDVMKLYQIQINEKLTELFKQQQARYQEKEDHVPCNNKNVGFFYNEVCECLKEALNYNIQTTNKIPQLKKEFEKMVESAEAALANEINKTLTFQEEDIRKLFIECFPKQKLKTVITLVSQLLDEQQTWLTNSSRSKKHTITSLKECSIEAPWKVALISRIARTLLYLDNSLSGLMKFQGSLVSIVILSKQKVKRKMGLLDLNYKLVTRLARNFEMIESAAKAKLASDKQKLLESILSFIGLEHFDDFKITQIKKDLIGKYQAEEMRREKERKNEEEKKDQEIIYKDQRDNSNSEGSKMTYISQIPIKSTQINSTNLERTILHFKDVSRDDQISWDLK